jgi:Bacterial protein of unknown function (DUF885)
VKLPRGWRAITHENLVKRLWRVHLGRPPIREVLAKAEPLSRKRGDDENAICDKTGGTDGGIDPASDYGRLNLELMRAVRLVVDTGIHSEGWTREQAVAYFRESDAANEPTIQAEIDRYIAWPAQGVSYQIGKLKILDLRNRANQQLGHRFDIRAFHDEILSGGSLPLDMLEARVNNWIGSQLPKGASR